MVAQESLSGKFRKKFSEFFSQIDHIDELFPSFEDGVRIIVGKETRNTMGVAEPTMHVKGYRERRVTCADLQYRAGCVVAIFYVFD